MTLVAAKIAILRSGDWLTRERVRIVALALGAASLLGVIFLVATSDGLNDRLGRPLGTDFSNVYAAGTYVREGKAAAPFDPAKQFLREQEIFGAATQFYGWHYPPFFLGVAAFLAAMPYALALLVWQGATLGLYLWMMRGVAPASRGHLPLLLAFAFPAVFINLGHGHNGFLTAALFGGALLLLDRRPIVAGILFGLIAYKPQFGVLIPFALGASGRWRAFAASGATVLVMAGATTLLFGSDIWNAFFASSEFTRRVVLEQGDTGWHKIQSVFSWARMWGAPVAQAYVAQALVTIAAICAVTAIWRSRAAFAHKAAALLFGTLIATPYSLDYDLMLLAPAIAFMAAHGLAHGFAAWEKTLLAALWIVPLIARSVAEIALVPLAVPAMLAALIFLMVRARNTAESHSVLQPAP
ncbi:MAG: DUF2029 domain-containing protein [Pseudolabrys sp.]|nr:DUF2029 domain-containing protein [Pseudolabrys sp.]